MCFSKIVKIMKIQVDSPIQLIQYCAIEIGKFLQREEKCAVCLTVNLLFSAKKASLCVCIDSAFFGKFQVFFSRLQMVVKRLCSSDRINLISKSKVFFRLKIVFKPVWLPYEQIILAKNLRSILSFNTLTKDWFS